MFYWGDDWFSVSVFGYVWWALEGRAYLGLNRRGFGIMTDHQGEAKAVDVALLRDDSWAQVRGGDVDRILLGIMGACIMSAFLVAMTRRLYGLLVPMGPMCEQEISVYKACLRRALFNETLVVPVVMGKGLHPTLALILDGYWH